MTIVICVIAIAMYAAIFGASIGRQLLAMFFSLSLLILVCYLIGYFTMPEDFGIYSF